MKQPTPIAQTWCANCTDDTPGITLTLGRLGPRDPEVMLCADCHPGTASRHRVRLGPERGYDVPDRPRLGAILPAFSKAADRVTGPVAPHVAGVFTEKRPGFVTVRVKRRGPDGRSRDANEARETLRGQPWFSELRHAGSDARYHLFDRPNTELAREVRSRPNADVMQQLAQAARKAGK